MAVAIITTDTWLSHLLFTGQKRQTEFGPIDGIFYGVVAGAGDASGGNLTLNGNVSFERKEDWIYILQKVSLSVADVNAGGVDTFIVAATGPLIPTATAVANASFHVAGDLDGVTGNALSVFQSNFGGESPFQGLPIFGDKKITGPLSMLAAGFQTNIDLAVYQLSVYGWLIEYQSFFRNLDPSRR